MKKNGNVVEGMNEKEKNFKRNRKKKTKKIILEFLRSNMLFLIPLTNA